MAAGVPAQLAPAGRRAARTGPGLASTTRPVGSISATPPGTMAIRSAKRWPDCPSRRWATCSGLRSRTRPTIRTGRAVGGALHLGAAAQHARPGQRQLHVVLPRPVAVAQALAQQRRPAPAPAPGSRPRSGRPRPSGTAPRGCRCGAAGRWPARSSSARPAAGRSSSAVQRASALPPRGCRGLARRAQLDQQRGRLPAAGSSQRTTRTRTRLPSGRSSRASSSGPSTSWASCIPDTRVAESRPASRSSAGLARRMRSTAVEDQRRRGRQRNDLGTEQQLRFGDPGRCHAAPEHRVAQRRQQPGRAVGAGVLDRDDVEQAARRSSRAAREELVGGRFPASRPPSSPCSTPCSSYSSRVGRRRARRRFQYASARGERSAGSNWSSRASALPRPGP